MFMIRSQTRDLRQEWSRRDLMKVAIGGAASWLPATFGAKCAAQGDAPSALASFGRAKACILIYLYGGPSHVDIWDLKPNAPSLPRYPVCKSRSTCHDWLPVPIAWRSFAR